MPGTGPAYSGPEPAKDTPGYAENHQGPALPTSRSAAGPTTTEGPMPYTGATPRAYSSGYQHIAELHRKSPTGGHFSKI